MMKNLPFGYIIRDEKVLSGKNYKNGLVEIKKEGEKVSKGDNVFRYYSNNENSLTEKIAKLDEEIQEALEGQTNVYSADIQLLDKHIEEELGKMLNTNNIKEIGEYKSAISEALIKKAKITGELSPSGSYISKLIEERRKYEEELNNGQEFVKTDMSGTVSYRIDGLEEVLSPNNFDNIDEKLLEGYNLKTGQMILESKEQGKVVNNYECYIVVFLKSDDAKNIEIGKSVTLRTSDSNEISAQIEYKREESDGNVMLVFKINKDVEELISYRKISIDVIWWSKEGLKVPNSAIIQENDLNYVLRNRIGYKDKILVKVLQKNENYAIIENYSTSELLELGYSEKEITSMKKIYIYDEIIIEQSK